MGRPTKTQRVINQLTKPASIAPAIPYAIPNRSGDHSAGHVEASPLSGTDIVNKAYVDGLTYCPGSNTQIIYNDNGVFGASANLIWNNTNKRLGVNVASPLVPVHINGTTYIDNGHFFMRKTGAGSDSQIFRIYDGDDKIFSIRKMASGETLIINNEGSFQLKPNNDSDNYLEISTSSNQTTINFVGQNGKITADSGTIDFANENLNTTGNISVGAGTFNGIVDFGAAGFNCQNFCFPLIAAPGAPPPGPGITDGEAQWDNSSPNAALGTPGTLWIWNQVAGAWEAH